MSVPLPPEKTIRQFKKVFGVNLSTYWGENGFDLVGFDGWLSDVASQKGVGPSEQANLTTRLFGRAGTVVLADVVLHDMDHMDDWEDADD